MTDPTLSASTSGAAANGATTIAANTATQIRSSIDEGDDFIAFGPSGNPSNTPNRQSGPFVFGGSSGSNGRSPMPFTFRPSDRGPTWPAGPRDYQHNRNSPAQRGHDRDRAGRPDFRSPRGTKRAHSPDASDDEQMDARTRARIERCWQSPAAMSEWLREAAPWSNGRRYDGEPAQMLHQEIADFVNYISPSPQEHEMRLLVVKRIERLVVKYWSNARLCAFGSFDTRLYLPTSDIDLVILLRTDTALTKDQQKSILRQLIGVLRKTRQFQEIRPILNARVPIVKCIDTLTGFPIDITVNVVNGIQGSSVVKRYLGIYPALKPLMLVLKQYLMRLSLNEVFTGGIGSYALMILVTSFLQMHPLVQTGQIRQEENLGVLLMELLELYGEQFSFSSTGISIADLGSYYDKRDKGRFQVQNPMAPSLEDPNDATNDVGRGTHNMSSVRNAFRDAFQVLKRALHTLKHNPMKARQPTSLSYMIQLIRGTKERREQVWERYYTGELHRLLGMERGFSLHAGSDYDPTLEQYILAVAQLDQASGVHTRFLADLDEDEDANGDGENEPGSVGQASTAPDYEDDETRFQRMARQMLRDQGRAPEAQKDLYYFVEPARPDPSITLSATDGRNTAAQLDDVVQRFTHRSTSAASVSEAHLSVRRVPNGTAAPTAASGTASTSQDLQAATTSSHPNPADDGRPAPKKPRK